MILQVVNLDRPELSFTHKGVSQAYINRAITFLSERGIDKITIIAKNDKPKRRKAA